MHDTRDRLQRRDSGLRQIVRSPELTEDVCAGSIFSVFVYILFLGRNQGFFITLHFNFVAHIFGHTTIFVLLVFFVESKNGCRCVPFLQFERWHCCTFEYCVKSLPRF